MGTVYWDLCSGQDMFLHAEEEQLLFSPFYPGKVGLQVPDTIPIAQKRLFQPCASKSKVENLYSGFVSVIHILIPVTEPFLQQVGY